MECKGIEGFSHYYFVGSKKKARDLEFVFQINFEGIIEENNATPEFFSEDSMFILENRNVVLSESIIDKYSLTHGAQYYYDEELFDFLNKQLAYEWLENPVAIWGTGQVSDDFVHNFNKVSLKNKIKYYVCTNRTQTSKNGIPILTPKEAADIDCKIIVAVNYMNFFEIEQECETVGISADRYLYYSLLLDNPGDFMRETYYDESYYPATCLNTDKTVRVQRNGNVCVCCLSNMKNIMGNIYEQSFDNAWSSIRAQICRVSLLNHTYAFCDRFRCPFLRGVNSDTKNADYSERYTYKMSEYPLSIAPEIDFSCNLYCTSCRNERLIEMNDGIDFWIKVIKKKLVGMPVDLVINTVGEPFASKYCLRLFEDMGDKQYNHLSVYTNGTLLTLERLENLIQQYGKLQLAVSVDAACEATYNKIRRGGNFTQLLKNLSNIARLRSEGKIVYWRLNFVVQKDNVSEMAEFIKMAEQLGADQVFFQEIENWGIYTEEEYCRVRVTEQNCIKERYRKYFTEDIVHNPKVMWGNLTHVVGGNDRFISLI